MRLRMLRAYLVTNPVSLLILALFHASGAVAGLFGSRAHSVARFYSRLLLRAGGVRVEVSGVANLARAGVCVLASNHLSYADTPLLLAQLPVEFRFLAKHSLFRMPVIGAHLRRGGHIRVLREDARGAAQSLAEARRVLKQGAASVLLFAEGSRSDGELRPFRQGAAHLAIQAGVPVVPIGIAGTGEILPKGCFTIRPGTARLRIGKPIPTDQMSPQDRSGLTARLQQEVAALTAAG